MGRGIELCHRQRHARCHTRAGKPSSTTPRKASSRRAMAWGAVECFRAAIGKPAGFAAKLCLPRRAGVSVMAACKKKILTNKPAALEATAQPRLLNRYDAAGHGRRMAGWAALNACNSSKANAACNWKPNAPTPKTLTCSKLHPSCKTPVSPIRPPCSPMLRCGVFRCLTICVDMNPQCGII